MTSYSALTTLQGKPQAEALGLALEDITPTPTGIGVFEIEDGSGLWEIGAYFTEMPDDVALSLLAAAYGAAPFTISEIPETDWVAHVKRELHAITAGRLFVYGSHNAHECPNDAIGLLIEAAMAFGTGHHGTTQGCLVAYDRLLARGAITGSTTGPITTGPITTGPVADIGCGTAVLAIAAAKTLDVPIIASDIDAVAVDVARANCTANDVAARITCLEATGFEHDTIHQTAPYALIFANILKGPLIDLSQPMAQHIQKGGHAILSGILNEQANDVIKAYEGAGFTMINRDIIGEWTTLTLQFG